MHPRRSEDVPVRPGLGDVPVATENGWDNDRAASGIILTPHSQADGDVGAPRGGAPGVATRECFTASANPWVGFTIAANERACA
jgi:hypothetical protein